MLRHTQIVMSTKLERLLEKEAQLKAQIQQAKAAERTLEKKRDTRRKILIGAAVMARVESGRWPKADLLEMMDGFLTRPHERDLFELDGEVSGSGDRTADSNGKAKAKQATKVGRDEKASRSKKAVKKLPESADDLASEFKL